MTQRQSLTRPAAVLDELTRTLKTEPRRHALEKFVAILRGNFDHYNWVGIYLVNEDKLILEAYAGAGETEHTVIPVSQGICGYAAKTGETLVVPDVSQDPRYLTCFPSTRSEIVVPIRGKDGVIGEIDIDSDTMAAFSKLDEEFLEAAAGELATYLEK
jgi:GAF domain-containing protein